MRKNQGVPGIVCDIDGVLLLDKAPLPLAAGVVEFLKKPLKEIDPELFPNDDSQLPFICLTNGGGMLERMKAESLNNILGLKEATRKFQGHEILLNYTALRPIMNGYQDKIVMVTGNGTIEAIAQSCGLHKYITMEEYCALYGAMVPVSGRPREGKVVDDMRKKIGERIGITDLSVFNKPLQIHAIFILNDPPLWYEYIQIICDLLSTPDGNVAEKFPEKVPEEHIPVYCTNNDLVYAGSFHLPRLTFGGFNETLKHIYKVLYQRDLDLNLYGKPFGVTYQYAEKHLKEMADRELSNIYMIGDNPKSDIRGAKAAGWKSILVETGVFKKTENVENDPNDPADYVVKNVQEAIKLIFELENIKCSLD